MFHDKARLTVIAGRGGDGSIHFRREKYVPKGGPDGGDGGDGGDVVLVADPRRRDLSGFRPNQKLRAGKGGPGGGRLSHGARGEDAVLHVPVGTQVLDPEERLVADLAQPGARVVVAKGGLGGRGNKTFAAPTRHSSACRTPASRRSSRASRTRGRRSPSIRSRRSRRSSAPSSRRTAGSSSSPTCPA